MTESHWTKDTSLLGYVSLGIFGAVLMGALIEDFGRPQHAYTIGWSHVCGIIAVIAWPAFCGYLIGRGRKS